MNVVLPIPDDLAASLAATGADLSRRALEAFAIEEFRAGHLTKPDLGRMLGLDTRDALDGFLKAHGEFEATTIADVERELGILQKLGI
ncbi:MAG TPA: hypothetical protein DDZ81_19005 [Acetobacteraceae bacterium]|jgi:hypothetical protein|nr:hypothetical protein [Acetobacteraceae bacterium]